MGNNCFNCKNWKNGKKRRGKVWIGDCDIVHSRSKKQPDGSIPGETYGFTICRWWERKPMLKFGKPKVTAVDAMNEIAKICRNAYNNMDVKEDFNSPAEKFGYEAWKYLMESGVFVTDEGEGQQKP